MAEYVFDGGVALVTGPRASRSAGTSRATPRTASTRREAGDESADGTEVATGI